MDYGKTLTKFITSQYWYAGVRMTFAILLPVVILYNLQLLSVMMALPLGALCVSLTDNPGPEHHRRNTMFASIVINGIMVLIAGLSRQYPMLLFIELAVFGLFFSLLGVYGNRVNNIGLIALLAFIFNIDSNLQVHNIFKDALWFTIGGTWYLLLTQLLYNIRPYKPAQQLLGECIMETAQYLQVKAKFYLPDPNFESLYQQLMKAQIHIHQLHEELRELLFKTRMYVNESTSKGRILNLMFLDAIDLFERIMTAQQDYSQLHQEFDDTNILLNYNNLIDSYATVLYDIGLAVQMGKKAIVTLNVQQQYDATAKAYFELRDRTINADKIETFIKLRNILFMLEDVLQRIHQLQNASSYDAAISRQYKQPIDKNLFVTKREIQPALLWSNISFKSSHFKHAVRVTVALLIGYTFSLFFPIGHSYWILLTIVTIIKPAYSITKLRNLHRLFGTLIGGFIGFLLIYFIKQDALLFVALITAMMLAYSFLRVQYLISTAGITIYVVLSFHFLNSINLQAALQDRIVDTCIGSLVAFLVSYFVLPQWEHQQIKDLLHKVLLSNKHYFNQVAAYFSQQPISNTNFKLARKDAFVSLANLSDTFQRMLTEPKQQQTNLSIYYQIVASNHLLTSYIASLAYYGQKSTANIAALNFKPTIQQINKCFSNVDAIIDENNKGNKPAPTSAETNNIILEPENITHKLSELLESRRQEIAKGLDKDSMHTRKQLSELKSIVDQFDLVKTILSDQIKMLRKLNDK